MRLSDLKKGSKIYCECSDGSMFFTFDHIDGAYSYCITEKGNIVHLSASAPMIKFKDGFLIVI